ncbi:type II toxin-antitoxin system toxin DNA ADP-ribosyl transferase DarT [Yoonia litorea]|uniref:DarT domain-containing protein n=1 Tax=Yoonia litorea TaxID=1123755 RepID=A0A1I6MWQ1_9RHOB|nr:DUF4433 domain-containing protein [Yoonia litorea]SFS20099.1 protein of unknown function [Yoonia litorea]
MSEVPDKVRIFHIVHVDRLPSIIADGFLWSDAETRRRGSPGTTVGMQSIKDRRLTSLLTSHPGLTVGSCVPFYFCPRSVMLYLLHRGNHEGVTYQGGQQNIVHLVADVPATVQWAEQNNKRWAFTLSNAGSGYFEDRSDLGQLGEVNWDAVKATQWGGNGVSRDIKEGKQAEFLVEHAFPWECVLGIGVFSQVQGEHVTRLISGLTHKPKIGVRRNWYY